MAPYLVGLPLVAVCWKNDAVDNWHGLLPCLCQGIHAGGGLGETIPIFCKSSMLAERERISQDVDDRITRDRADTQREP